MHKIESLFSLLLMLVGIFTCPTTTAQSTEASVVWKFSAKASFVSSPAISNNIIYIGSIDSSFYAINSNSGNLIWKIKTNGDIRSTAFIQSNKIYFVSGDGFLWCVDLNGKILWKFKTNFERKYELFSFADYFQSSPIVDTDMVFFGSGDSFIYAVHAVSGKLIWKYKTADVVHATPCIFNDNLFLGSFDGYLYSLNRHTGKLQWKFKSVGQTYFPKGEFNGSATAYNGKVFVGARDYNFYALDANKPYCHWNKSFPKGWAITTPLISDSLLYIGTSDDRLFLCLDPETGFQKWKFDAGYNIFSAPAIKEGIVYFGTMMGHLYGLNSQTGIKTFDFTTDGYKKNKNMYFKESEAYRDDIYAIIRRNEDFLTLYENMGAIISKPIVTDNTIIISSMDGTVYCIAK